MNIFFLDTDPRIAAQYHCDKHVVKMILESAQLLSTTHWVLDSEGPYKKTHENHPSAIWVRESLTHYSWLWLLMSALGTEYTYRYKKEHKTIIEHQRRLMIPPIKLKVVGWLRDPPQAMPDHCKGNDTVEAYRKYYITEKADLLKYTHREEPNWIKHA